MCDQQQIRSASRIRGTPIEGQIHHVTADFCRSNPSWNFHREHSVLVLSRSGDIIKSPREESDGKTYEEE